MSKPVKELVIGAYKGKFEDVTGALVLDIRGLTSNDNNALRSGLLKKQIRVTVVKNSLAKKAFSGTALDPLGPALEGPSALAYGESGPWRKVSPRDGQCWSDGGHQRRSQAH